MVFRDGNGSLVWGSDPLQTFEFRAHQYQGDSVFASFNGSIKTGGFGEGWFQIWNSSYDVIQEVHFVSDQGNEQTDFHELQITTNDTFLLGAYVSVPWDLTSKDGIADGWT